jgi:hypothetical protein
MKSDNLYAISEIIRASTPFFFASAGLVIILGAVVHSEKLPGDRFIYVLASAGPLLGFAGGGFSPQNRSPQNRISADQVDIDQSK